MPSVDGNVTVDVNSAGPFFIGESVNITGVGGFTVASITNSTTLMLTNSGDFNGTSAAKVIPGTTVSSGAVISNDVTTTTATDFTMPSVSQTVTVTVASTDSYLVGEYLYIAGAGGFTVSSIPSGTTLDLLNLGYTYNSGSVNADAGATISTGAAVTGSRIYDATIDANGNETDTYKDMMGRVIETAYPDGSYSETLYSVGSSAVSKDLVGASLPNYPGVPGGSTETVQIAQRKSTDPIVATYDIDNSSGELTDVYEPAVIDGNPADTSTYGDPVVPHWQYGYDNFGDETTQTSPEDNVTTFKYDQNGNEVQEILPDSTTGSPQVEYTTYNQFQQEATHTDFDGNVATYTYYPDGNVHEGLLESVVYVGSAGHANQTYVLGNTVLAQVTSGGTASYLLTDGHGSTRALMNSGGAVTSNSAAVFNYDAFGTPLNFTASSAGTIFLFGGDAVYDATSGLYMNGDGVRDRRGFEFIQMGPTKGTGQDPLSLHKYLYADADPINNNDPSGYDDNSLEDEAFGDADEDVAEDVGGYIAVYTALTGGVTEADASENEAFGEINAELSVYQAYAEAWLNVAQNVALGAVGGILGGAASESFAAADGAAEGSGEAAAFEDVGESDSEISGDIDETGELSDEGGNDDNPGCFLAGTDVLLGDGQEEQIQDIRVGQRVATDGGVANSPTGTKATDPNSTEVDPATWRLVTMQLDDSQVDGQENIVSVQALEPLTEIAEEGAKVGSFIPVPLDLQEMGLPNLPAQVISITACPTIASGSGRVVLATVTHLNNNVFDLTLSNAKGQSEVIGVTAYHLIYTEDRGWIAASQLQMGETIQGAGGNMTVAGLTPDAGVFQVYNMDVESDHVYYVGDLPALVHNTCPTPQQLWGDTPQNERAAINAAMGIGEEGAINASTTPPPGVSAATIRTYAAAITQNMLANAGNVAVETITTMRLGILGQWLAQL